MVHTVELSGRLFNSILDMIRKYIRESFADLNNVTWPTRKQGIRITTIVFIFMIASAAVLGFVDQILAWGTRILIDL